MPKFDKSSFEVGGTIVVPDSRVCTSEGQIVGVHNAGITVKYTSKGMTCFYSFTWLNEKYGLNDEVPFDL